MLDIVTLVIVVFFVLVAIVLREMATYTGSRVFEYLSWVFLLVLVVVLAMSLPGMKGV